MKKSNIFSLCLLALAIVILPSCNKFADGPAFSLLSKKSRVTGEWKINQILVNGVDFTSTYKAFIGEDYVLDIEKGGTYHVHGTVTDEGTWELGEDGDDIRFQSNKSGAKEESYRILRLKKKELWYKQTQTNGEVVEIHYLPA